MKQYKVFFINGESLPISSETKEILVSTMIRFAQNDFDFERSIVLDLDEAPIIRLSTITHISVEEIGDLTKGVVTPPTPQELKSEQERAEANKDVSLDAQLSGEI